VIRLPVLLSLALLAIPLSGHQPAPLTPYTFRHPAMGTEFTLYLYAASEPQASATAVAVFDEVDRIEQELSNYRASSELSRIDREAAFHPVTTDPETFRFLVQSQHWSAASDGAFDITVGPLMQAWGFFGGHGHIPTDAELAQIRPAIGFRNLELDPATRTVRFRIPGVDLDPGGIGKGFAVDAAVAILHQCGIQAALLSAGSSTLYGLGHPPGEPGWRVVIPNPEPTQPPISTAILRDTSISSANCNEKHFTQAGHLFCHIMDPRTLHPVEGRVHVTIVDPSATASDALSNVLFVDTPQQSLRFLARHRPAGRAIIVSGTAAAPRCTVYNWQASVDSKLCPGLH
jgi:thiamine biosynthesis lipoprotein